MKTFLLSALSIPTRHQLLVSAVGPRPIALASTTNLQGQVNLSPFSFFNIFSSNPPIAVFSVSRRGYDSSVKDTFLNLKEVPEVAINMVNYSMGQQISLASNEYPQGVNEFEKAGFTMKNCDIIRPPYVGEAPVVLECKVSDIITLGDQGASGNLILCRILKMHVREEFLDKDDNLDSSQLDLIGRMGANWYCRAFGDALFEITKPSRELAIGIDRLPQHIKTSIILNGNDLGQLGSQPNVPSDDSWTQIRDLQSVKEIRDSDLSQENKRNDIHQKIKALIDSRAIEEALALAFWADEFL
ncbi:MAG: flavin reductase family protein [Saprospiraceae bacterium]|nr:flavin reductase family protein [Saprospiraceae bacterium]